MHFLNSLHTLRVGWMNFCIMIMIMMKTLILKTAVIIGKKTSETPAQIKQMMIYVNECQDFASTFEGLESAGVDCTEGSTSTDKLIYRTLVVENVGELVSKRILADKTLMDCLL